MSREFLGFGVTGYGDALPYVTSAAAYSRSLGLHSLVLVMT